MNPKEVREAIVEMAEDAYKYGAMDRSTYAQIVAGERGRMIDPPHPGRLLKSALKALDLSPEQFASKIGVSTDAITAITLEKEGISPKMAIRLAQAIAGPDAATWLRMQAEYDAWQTIDPPAVSGRPP